MKTIKIGNQVFDLDTEHFSFYWQYKDNENLMVCVKTKLGKLTENINISIK